MEDDKYTWGQVSYAPPYTATSSGAPMPLTINGNGTYGSVNTGTLSGNTITVTGTTTGGSTGGYVISPNTSTYGWTSQSPLVQHDVLRIQTAHGPITIKYDGTVDYPDELDDAAKEFWDKISVQTSQHFMEEVRKEAARQVKEILPRLVPELEPYRMAMMHIELAMAIRMEQK